MRRQRSLVGLMAALVAIALILAVADARSGPDGDAASGPRSNASTSQETSSRGPAPPGRAACPRALDPGSRAPEKVIRALRQQVPRLFDIVAYGRRAKLTPANTEVLDIRPLGSTHSDLPGIRTLRSTTAYYATIAERLCGPRIVSATWVAILYFEDAPAVPFAYHYAFLSRTAGGWKLWYHRQAQNG